MEVGVYPIVCTVNQTLDSQASEQELQGKFKVSNSANLTLGIY